MEIKKPTEILGRKELKNGTVIRAHRCAHEYQDARYGRGQRVCNLSPKDGKARCTVCGEIA